MERLRVLLDRVKAQAARRLPRKRRGLLQIWAAGFILALGWTGAHAAPAPADKTSNPPFACVQDKSTPEEPASEPPKPTAHTLRKIDGWMVHIDNRLLSGPDRAIGTRALHVLDMRLFAITLIVPADKVKRLQEVPIWIDRTHGKLSNMQYHPNIDWLRENGYDTRMAKCVHIPDAVYFSSSLIQFQQPWAVLHELSHAYHDQVLNFDNPEITAAWHRFVAGGKYKSVPHMNGRMREHYALTNPMEFFAEMTETYFGMNDFYPFNHVELKREEPELYVLMAKIWGPLP